MGCASSSNNVQEVSKTSNLSELPQSENKSENPMNRESFNQKRKSSNNFTTPSKSKEVSSDIIHSPSVTSEREVKTSFGSCLSSDENNTNGNKENLSDSNNNNNNLNRDDLDEIPCEKPATPRVELSFKNLPVVFSEISDRGLQLNEPNNSTDEENLVDDFVDTTDLAGSSEFYPYCESQESVEAMVPTAQRAERVSFSDSNPLRPVKSSQSLSSMNGGRESFSGDSEHEKLRKSHYSKMGVNFKVTSPVSGGGRERSSSSLANKEKLSSPLFASNGRSRRGTESNGGLSSAPTTPR